MATTYLVNSASQTVDDIVDNLIVSTRLPISQITFTPQIIIGFLQDEQQTTVESLVRSVREDYWVTNYDQTILTNTYSYGMPPRCVAGALRKVVFVDPSNFEIEVPHLDSDQIATPSYFAFRPSWQGQGYFIQDDQIVLWPQTFSNVYYQLRQRYERRPNSLTSVDNCAQIVSVNVAANQIAFAASPPFIIGDVLDIISSKGQFHSDIDDALISNVSGATVTFDTSTPITSKVRIGDWACPAGLTCIPQVPAEGYPLLLARGMLRIAAAFQNTNLFNVASKMSEDAAAKIMTMFTPRVSGGPKKFVNKNTMGGIYSFPYYR
jgi:hypothetical protein